LDCNGYVIFGRIPLLLRGLWLGCIVVKAESFDLESWIKMERIRVWTNLYTMIV